MDELKKIVRVLRKLDPAVPHSTPPESDNAMDLLVLFTPPVPSVALDRYPIIAGLRSSGSRSKLP